MNPLERALLEKAGNDHGLEHVLPAEAEAVSLASARHRAQVRIVHGTNGSWILTIAAALSRRLLSAELARSFPDSVAADGSLVARNIAELAKLLRRTAELAHSLPNQAQSDFEREIALELAKLSADGIRATEVAHTWSTVPTGLMARCSTPGQSQ